MQNKQGFWEAAYEIYNDPRTYYDNASCDKRNNIFITDLYGSIHDVPVIPGPDPEIFKRPKKNIFDHFARVFAMFDMKFWLLLALTGIFCGFSGVFIDYMSVYMWRTRLEFIQGTPYPILRFVTFYFSGFILASFSTGMGGVFAQDSDGSGMSEMKSILGGVDIYKYLDFNIYAPKAFGLIAASGAGLSIGREGPFVHLSAIIAHRLCKIPYFKDIEKIHAVKKSVLQASVAAGVTSCFGAVIGGVLFSIETTTSKYNVTNLWRSYFCAGFCIVTTKLLKKIFNLDAIKQTEFEPYVIGYELLGFAALGLIIGLLIVSAEKLIVYLTMIRRTFGKFWLYDRYHYTWVVFTITCILGYQTEITLLSDRLVQNIAYNNAELSTNEVLAEPSPMFNLYYYIAFKYIATVLAISAPVPAGVGTPWFTFGASFGRMYGEHVHSWFPNLPHKGGFGVVAGAASVANITRSIAVAMMALEITGQMVYWLPILVGVLVSYTIGHLFTFNIFEVMLHVKKLPNIPSLLKGDFYKNNAGQIMVPENDFLTEDLTPKDLINFLQKLQEINKANIVPIVNNHKDQILVGSVNMSSLLKYLDAHFSELPVVENAQQSKTIDFLRTGLKKFGTIYEKELQVIGDSRVVKHSMVARAQSIAELENEPFFTRKIDLNDPILNVDPAPLSVTPLMYVSKMHFLFATAGIVKLFVVQEGRLVGSITKQEIIAPSLGYDFP